MVYRRSITVINGGVLEEKIDLRQHYNKYQQLLVLRFNLRWTRGCAQLNEYWNLPTWRLTNVFHTNIISRNFEEKKCNGGRGGGVHLPTDFDDILIWWRHNSKLSDDPYDVIGDVIIIFFKKLKNHQNYNYEPICVMKDIGWYNIIV